MNPLAPLLLAALCLPTAGDDGPPRREIPLDGFTDLGSLAVADLDGAGAPDIFLSSRTKKEVLLYSDPGADALRLATPAPTLPVSASFSSAAVSARGSRGRRGSGRGRTPAPGGEGKRHRGRGGR